jgi:hypothetical protein
MRAQFLHTVKARVRVRIRLRVRVRVRVRVSSYLHIASRPERW